VCLETSTQRSVGLTPSGIQNDFVGTFVMGESEREMCSDWVLNRGYPNPNLILST